jgi:hypothetical protein
VTGDAFTDKADKTAIDSSSLLARVLLVTQEMLDLAHKGQWDLVTSKERDRRVLLADCFADPVPTGQSQLFSEALAAMLHMNEEMIGLLEAAKENVAIKRTDQSHKKRSLGHYLDIEKSH